MVHRRIAQHPNRPPRFVLYSRVSTDEQARHGISLEEQRERLEAYCRAQGWRIVALEADRGASGTLLPEKRPGLCRALTHVRVGRANGIAAVSLSRISRRALHALQLFEAADREGWRLAVLDLGVDTGTPVGKAVATVLAAMAELERNQTAERTRLALAQVAREGRPRSRFLPFGWRSRSHPQAVEAVAGDRSGLVPHAEEQRLLDEMLRLHRRGLGSYAITTRLNRHHVNPRTRGPFTRAGVAAVLRTAERRATLGA
jgi:site-specific DNA recombinase